MITVDDDDSGQPAEKKAKIEEVIYLFIFIFEIFNSKYFPKLS